MKVGIALPTMVPGLTRDILLSWMREVDEGPFSVLACGERVAYPNQDMMSVLAAAAAVTQRVAIEATVSLVPMHSAVHVAKQAATIDVLSNGRFVLGVGVGGRDEDYRAIGASFARRHARLDEQVATMKRVWRGEALADDVSPVGPPPVQPGGPKVLTASMGPKSMARAAQWADGIAGFDTGPNPAGIGGTFAAFTSAWRAAGREGEPYRQTSFWFGLGANAATEVPAYAYRYLRIFGHEMASALSQGCCAVSEDAVRDLLRQVADTGCDEAILVATTSDVDDLRRAVQLIGVSEFA
ncbi:MAG TPA: LLM class flavin-dependent oxidoreductase [Acidimicrobiia bacterium]|nr:LLM class flavin-dependent oxidoreductase [Acidimicrobiia bacterium]